MQVASLDQDPDSLLIKALVDYNSWQESETGIKLANSLDKNVVLAEGKYQITNLTQVVQVWAYGLKGYKEYDTKRKYLVTLGDWRNNKDEEVELDGIGGVNILVKADVHRSGGYTVVSPLDLTAKPLPRDQFPVLCVREPSRDGRIRQNGQKSRLQGRGLAELRCVAY